ncbi:hypothetical protein H5410_003430 [Solanum commersonii]|uniref:Uncharacterized protein n=1 Tax=Solanum commersonii TaxID=4109 RepID=A0A9J6B4U4_SOLCO|nr:hypothetical protein H5410_003430 [Solanum commersonii]
MIPYSHTEVNQFKIRNQMQHSHSKKRNTMHIFTHRFALIFQSTFDSAYSRSKRLTVKILGLFIQVSKQANLTRHRQSSQTRLHTFASVQ